MRLAQAGRRNRRLGAHPAAHPQRFRVVADDGDRHPRAEGTTEESMILTLESLPRYCTEEGDCLIWNQSCNSGGKPQARLDGKGWLVQRYVYFVLKERPIDAKLRLTTRCGHRMCVSPDCIVASSYGAILKRAYAKGNRSTALEYTKRVVYLEDEVGGIASSESIEFFSDNYSWSTLPTSKQFAQKDGYRFFMEKEIYEQSTVVSDCMLGRIKDEEILFEEINASIIDGINEIKN